MIILLTGCVVQSAAQPNRPPQTTLTIFAAASLTESFTQLATEFEATHPDVDIALNFAGSQALRLQLEQGAYADLFASADVDHMAALAAANLVHPPVIFAENQLVVILPQTNPANITSLADLTRPGLKLVLAAPNVPVGRYAHQVLTNLNQHPSFDGNFSAQVLDNLVSEEDNVKGVMAKVGLGEADAGIVYRSDVTSTEARNFITLTIPPEYNVTATYPVAVVRGSTQPQVAQDFVGFVRSPQGQRVLDEHGFQSTQLQTAKNNP